MNTTKNAGYTVRKAVDPLRPCLPLYSGAFEKSVRVGEAERPYIVYIPDGTRESTAGLFILPENGKTAAEMLASSGWRGVADSEERKEKLILFFLQPPEDGWHTNEPYGAPGGDVAYVNAVYTAGCERLQFCVHESKNYLLGYKQGGTLAQMAAMWNPAVYAGLCAVAGGGVNEAYRNAAAGALCTNLHGYEDPAGRQGIRKGNIPLPVWLIEEPGAGQTAETAAYWQKANGTNGIPRRLAPDTLEYYRSAPTQYPSDQHREAYRVWVSETEDAAGNPAMLNRRIWKDFLYRQRRWMGDPGGDLRMTQDPVMDLRMEYHYELVGGWMREWYVYVPQCVRENPAQRVPLVFAMHGYTCSGEIYAGNAGWHTLAERHGFVVVYPTATYGSIGQVRNKAADPNNMPLPAWNFLQEDGRPDELAFFCHMLAEAGKTLPIDSRRVFATGHSHGSLMTQALGLAMPEVFAAIAPCSGVLLDLPGVQEKLPNLPEVQARKDIPVPVWMFCGAEEEWLIPSHPTDDNATGFTIALWRRLNGISPAVPPNWNDGWAVHNERWHDLTYEKDGLPLVKFTCVDYFPHATTIAMSQRIWDEFFSRICKSEAGELSFYGSECR